MSEILDSTRFRELFGISEATLSRWIKRGMPHLAPSGKNGAKWFNVEKASAWMEVEPILTGRHVSMHPQPRRQAGRRQGERTGARVE